VQRRLRKVNEFDFDPYGLQPGGGVWILLTSFVLLAIALALSRVRSVGMERDMTIAAVRGFLQVMAIGFIIFAVFKLEDLRLAVTVLAFIATMVAFATFTSSRRAKDLPRPAQATFWGILAGAAVTLGVMVGLSILPLRPEFVIPIAGMVIGNSMIATSLALNRLLSEARGYRERIEARLTLGADVPEALRPHVRASIRASVIPMVDSLKTLGIVFIPGGMTGMVIGGVDPVWAAQYQLVIFFMIFCSTMLATTISTMLAGRQLVEGGVCLVELPEEKE
jgi:putative ABC transport system permease protein